MVGDEPNGGVLRDSKRNQLVKPADVDKRIREVRPFERLVV
jgi:hypothetical protein